MMIDKIQAKHSYTTYTHKQNTTTKTKCEHLQNTQYYNQNKNCTSLCLKNGHGADKTSQVIEFQRNMEFTKKEYLQLLIEEDIG